MHGRQHCWRKGTEYAARPRGKFAVRPISHTRQWGRNGRPGIRNILSSVVRISQMRTARTFRRKRGNYAQRLVMELYNW